MELSYLCVCVCVCLICQCFPQLFFPPSNTIEELFVREQSDFEPPPPAQSALLRSDVGKKAPCGSLSKTHTFCRHTQVPTVINQIYSTE